MESNWRWNVFATGMWKSTWILAARWNVLGEWYVVKRTNGIFTIRSTYQVVFPGTLPVHRSSVVINPAVDRFPYGFDVLPD